VDWVAYVFMYFLRLAVGGLFYPIVCLCLFPIIILWAFTPGSVAWKIVRGHSD